MTHFVHIEIPADDTGASTAFYGALFGWEFQAFPGAGEYHMARIDDNSGAAVMTAQPGQQGPRAYFDVDDIKAGAAKVAELGGTAGDPMPVPGMGWFVTCNDPHGNDFGLWQTDSAAA